jgi:protein-disulfide isomerase
MLWFVLGGGVAAVAAWQLLPQIGVSPERIHATLRADPELLADQPELVEAANAAIRRRAQASDAAARATLLRGKWSSFTSAATSPRLGNPAGSLLLIEFTDYACVPCKASAGVVRQAVAERPDLRVAIVLLPATGAMSELAARVALVAYRNDPKRFQDLHQRLMEEKRALSQQVIAEHVSAAGLDVETVFQGIADPDHRQYLGQARAFAADLGVAGVPAFALGGALLLGGVSATTLNTLIENASKRGTEVFS